MHYNQYLHFHAAVYFPETWTFVNLHAYIAKLKGAKIFLKDLLTPCEP